MTTANGGDDVWFGLLAVQAGLLSPETVLAAARAIDAPQASLAEELVRKGLLSASDQSQIRSQCEQVRGSDLPVDNDGFAAALQTALCTAPTLVTGRADVVTRVAPGEAAGNDRPQNQVASGTLCAPVAPLSEASGMTPPVSSDRAGAHQEHSDPFATRLEETHAGQTPRQPDVDPSATHAGSGVDVAGGPREARLAQSPGQERFRILRLHARGGLGQVSVAQDEEIGREVALKEIQEQYADDSDARARFIREAAITGHLEHPGIVPVYGMGATSTGRPYYAMRFIQGHSLRQALQEFHEREVTDDSERLLELRELLGRFIAVCNAMEYAHSRGVIHRDLKPANIMLGPYGETLVVDWGLAKCVGQPDVVLIPADRGTLSTHGGAETLDGSTVGTPQYMSAEQAAGRLSEVGPLSDVYSLGATLYHLLSGRAPLSGTPLVELLALVERGEIPPPRSVLAAIPEPLEAICLKAMSVRPADRYPSARALAADLEHWLADEPVSAHRETWVQRGFRWLRRHRAWTQGVATMLPLLVVVATIAMFVVDRARRAEVKSREDAERQRDLSILAHQSESRERKKAEESRQAAVQSEKRARAAQVRAVSAQAKAQAASIAARKAAEETRRNLFNLLVANGQKMQEEGDVAGAAIWFGRALPLVVGWKSDIEQAHRLRLGMILRRLPRPVRMWTLAEDLRKRLIVPTLSPDGRQVLFTGAVREVVGIDTATGQALWPALPHAALPAFAGYSADGSRIVTLCPPHEMRVWDSRTGSPLTAPMLTEKDLSWPGFGPDSKAEFSADNRLLVVTAVAQSERSIEVWDVESGTRRFPPLSFEGELAAVRLSRDGKRLFIGTKQATGQWYDTATGERAGDPIGIAGLWSARYSPDGNWLVATSGEGESQLWDATTQTLAATLIAHHGPVTEAVFSPDSKRLITLHSDRAARLWEIPSGKILGPLLVHGERPLFATFRGDGQQVLTISLDHTVRVWDVETGRLLAAPFRRPTFCEAAFIDQQVLIVTAGHGGVWDIERSANPGEIRFEPAGSIQHIAFSPRGGLLAAAGTDRAWLLDPAAGNRPNSPVVHGGKLQDVAVSPDGSWLATAGDDGTAQLWRMADGQPHGSRLVHRGPVLRVRFDPHSRQLLTCSQDRTARLWDVATGEPSGAPLAHEGAVRDGDFSPDSRLVVTGGDDSELRLWDSATGELVSEPHAAGSSKETPITQVRFNSQGTAVVAGYESGEVIVRAPVLKEPEFTRFSFEGAVSRTEFSADGTRLLIAGYANWTSLWNRQQPLDPPIRYPAGFMAIQASLSPGSEWVATGSFEGVRLWQAGTGQALGPPLWKMTRALAFSPEGRWLATVDQTLRLWDLTPESRAPDTVNALIRLLAAREIDDRTGVQFLSAAQQQALFDAVRHSSPAETAGARTSTFQLPPAP